MAKVDGLETTFVLPQQYEDERVRNLPREIYRVLDLIESRDATGVNHMDQKEESVTDLWGPYETGIVSKRNPDKRKVRIKFKDGTEKNMSVADLRLYFPRIAAMMDARVETKKKIDNAVRSF